MTMACIPYTKIIKVCSFQTRAIGVFKTFVLFLVFWTMVLLNKKHCLTHLFKVEAEEARIGKKTFVLFKIKLFSTLFQILITSWNDNIKLERINVKKTYFNLTGLFA